MRLMRPSFRDRQPGFGTGPGCRGIERGREAASRQAHILETAGSNPALATTPDESACTGEPRRVLVRLTRLRRTQGRARPGRGQAK